MSQNKKFKESGNFGTFKEMDIPVCVFRVFLQLTQFMKIACTNLTISKVTCKLIGIKLLYKIMNVNILKMNGCADSSKIFNVDILNILII